MKVEYMAYLGDDSTKERSKCPIYYTIHLWRGKVLQLGTCMLPRIVGEKKKKKKKKKREREVVGHLQTYFFKKSLQLS